MVLVRCSLDFSKRDQNKESKEQNALGNADYERFILSTILVLIFRYN